MKIIAVDDEQLALQNLVTMLKRVEAAAEIVSFSDSQEALSYLAENQADIVFLDIEMGELNGIALAVKMCYTGKNLRAFPARRPFYEKKEGVPWHSSTNRCCWRKCSSG